MNGPLAAGIISAIMFTGVDGMAARAAWMVATLICMLFGTYIWFSDSDPRGKP